MRLAGGETRTVVLTRRWAIKIPGVWRKHPRHWWRGLLLGLLANQQEREFAACGWHELCPVSFSLWGGWLIVMPRLEVLTTEEWSYFADSCKMFDLRLDVRDDGTALPVEMKADGWAWIGDAPNREIVAIDYGGGGLGGRARRPGLRPDQ